MYNLFFYFKFLRAEVASVSVDMRKEQSYKDVEELEDAFVSEDVENIS